MQHHWRGVIFERSLLKKDYDPSVCARLRAMHMVNHLELRHQFKMLREAMGFDGLPANVVEAYVTILYHLTRSKGSTQTDKAYSAMVADQKKIIGSGALVFLASLITTTQRREIVEMVKEIVLHIASSQGEDKIVDVLVCNVAHRVAVEIEHLMEQKVASTNASMMSSVHLIAVLSEIVLASKRRYGSASPSKAKMDSATNSLNPSAGGIHSEQTYLLHMLEKCAKAYFITPFVVQTLFSALQYDPGNPTFCVNVLNTLRMLAGSFGFTLILDALTRNGGRSLERVTSYFDHRESSVVSAAVSMFYELTDRPDARKGMTTAGAIQLFIRWCGAEIETTATPLLHALGIMGIALLARQTHQATSSAKLLSSLQTLPDRLDVVYDLLLDLVRDENPDARHAEKTAAYLLSVRALPVLLQFLIQVKPSCMDSPYQCTRQRNISCIVLGRLFKVPEVAQFCFSEALVNHLALSLQCNRLDEIEHLVSRMPAQERYIHRLGSKEACKALGRLSRCPSTSVNAKLKPSITSANVPELPQALICDVMFRLHSLEDLIAQIRYPSDGAEFVGLELDSILAAIELAGYLRPVPFGEAARVKFLKANGSHSHGKYAREKLLSLVELVAPAILHVLREKNACFRLVSVCCATLSRLACTNAACNLLLSQGCLQIALIHLPQILFASPDRATRHRGFVYDSSVDDHGLLDVPSSLFTLVGKLCAVAEGRAAVMRAQVLPRLLKRLQLTHPASRSVDEDCKGEIAVVIQQLAMSNTIEGNTSELFLHFHVLELLTQLARDQEIPTLRKGKPQRWRLLDHVLGAIAALSQDVLVCVPKVAEMGVLHLIMPFIVRERKDEAVARAESLQYHAVSIVRSVASYPFGEYHSLLQSVEEKHAGAGSARDPASLMERVKKVAYNFALELENRPTSSMDKKSVGELARETLSFVNELAQRASAPFHDTGAGSRSSSSLSPLKTTHKQEREALPASPQRRESRGPATRMEPSALVALDSSPASLSPRYQLAPVRSTSALPVQSAESTPSPQKLASQVVLATSVPTALSSNNLGGVDLLATRPTKGKPQPADPAKSSVSMLQTAPCEHSVSPYMFTRPTPSGNKKTKQKDMSSCLMLDPLFQPSASVASPSFMEHGKPSTKQHAGRRKQSRTDEDKRNVPQSEGMEEEDSFLYSQEIDRFGHCVNVKARRAKSGDNYIRSLGHISMSGARQVTLG